MSDDVVQWTDKAMFEAQPMQMESDLGRVVPQVALLSATPDPLGALTAGFRMYRGDPVYSLEELTNEDREWGWQESLKTHLKAPWEFIDMMFMIEGVTRSFTHQMVRQRTAVYAQESLRFAVKRGFAKEVALPPSLLGSTKYDGEHEGPAKIFMDMVEKIDVAYNQLIDAGIPAEDARGLLPHCVTTRIIYKTNFRGLIEHAGNRLCTQAQFEWRAVFLGIMKAIREYGNDPDVLWSQNGWQFRLLAEPIAETFTPVCYKAGRCVFMGKLDRGCTIRDRVEKFAQHGVPSEHWAIEAPGELTQPIHPIEWMANPLAGITYEDSDRPQG